MTYTPNVPTSGQTLGNSRPIINSNFMLISEDFGVNHVNFGLANAGCHIHADLLAQASDPNPLTTIVSHYSKQIGGITEWYFQREGTAGPTPGHLGSGGEWNLLCGAVGPHAKPGTAASPASFSHLHPGLVGPGGGDNRHPAGRFRTRSLDQASRRLRCDLHHGEPADVFNSLERRIDERRVITGDEARCSPPPSPSATAPQEKETAW